MGATCYGQQQAQTNNGQLLLHPQTILNIKQVNQHQQHKKELLYDMSRMVACHGIQVQKKLMKMQVFVIGLTGLGIQVAKNLILIGPKKISIFDKTNIEMHDVGRNCYFSIDQVQKQTKVTGCLKMLKDLNPRVEVTEAQNDDIDFITSNFNCVVVLDNYNKQYLFKLNQVCRFKNIPFILGGNLGLYGYSFVDFGEKHQIFDLTGRQPKRLMIKSISNQVQGVLEFHQDGWHGFNNGDKVKIINVKGMNQVNLNQFQVTINHENTSIQINVDTSNYNKYLNGGQLVEIKKIIPLSFKSFQQTLKNPYVTEQGELIYADWSKVDNPPQLHILLNSMYKFYQNKKRITNILDSDDNRQFLQIAKERFNTFKAQIPSNCFNSDNLNLQLTQDISNFGSLQISACCSFWGGIIAQQVIKATGKYKPIYQWFHHDFTDIIPKIQRSKSAITNSRYQDYEILFGKQFVDKCSSQNLFVVGAGALGCQYIKMFALMGLGTKQKGNIFVTDDDNIQTSNLSRQFLFKQNHIGKNKCQIACQIGQLINRQTNFNSKKLRLTPQTQSTFNDTFWNNLDFVVNAVDNVQARNSIDQKCIFYEKPCFQSGTSGTSCSSQIIIPKFTATYSDIGQSKQKQIAPSCTIKSFPYKIQHVIPWAKELFRILFQTPSQDLLSFHSNKLEFVQQMKKKMIQSADMYKRQLKILKDLLILNQKQSYQSCIQYIVILFNTLFKQKIQKLLQVYPQNLISQQTGKPYWSGVKKCPQVININLKDNHQLNFIRGGANIISDLLKINKKLNDQQILDFLKSSPLKQANQMQQKPQQTSAQILSYLEKYEIKQKRQFQKIQFDKDNHLNFHLQFLSGATNLRAKNYKIQQADDLTIKVIAGKIIPAIATTTAMIVGCIGIQIIKYILNGNTGNFMNLSANLSVPDWSFASPLEKVALRDKQRDEALLCPVKYLPTNFTKWDKIYMDHPKTLKQLNQHFDSQFKHNIYAIQSSGIFLSQEKLRAYQEDTIKEIFQKQLKKQYGNQKKWLKVQVLSKEGNGTLIYYPIIKYKLF